jgi:hypothetical protein
VNLILPEAYMRPGIIDILMAHGALRLHQVMVELMIEAIGERLAHGMAPHLPGALVRRRSLMQDAARLHLTDGPVGPLPAHLY